MQWVVAYDIADDRRRTKLLKLLRNYGGYSVQESVVEGDWDATEWELVYFRVRQSIHHRSDTVIFYCQCATCLQHRVEIGVGADRPTALQIVDSATRPLGSKSKRQPKAKK